MGGRAVERHLTLPVEADSAMIGVKPASSGRSLADGANADFDVVLVAPDGKLMAKAGLRYSLLKVETSYQWYRQNGQWDFEPIKRTEKVADGTLDATADKPAHLSLPVKWGRYRLEVSAPETNGPLTSLSFDAGFYAESSADTPDLLEVALDKTDYKSGDIMNVAVTAAAAGAHVNVFTDRLVSTTTQEVKAGTVKHQWSSARTGAPAPILSLPCGGRSMNRESACRGAQSACSGSPSTAPRARFAVTMQLPATLRPNSTLSVPVHVAGLAPGEEARVVVAAVDVGILNLTNYKPPAPDDFYLGQRRLTAEIRDIYGQLIDGMQGAAGKIRSGGDIGAVALSGSPPTQAPLALYSGIVTVGRDGVAQVHFDISAFAGTVRVTAVAWSKDKVGKATGDVVVRDPVVLTATLPRFLRTGDKGAVQLEFDNVEGAAGDYDVAVGAEGAVKLGSDKPLVVKLAAKQRSACPCRSRQAERGRAR